MQSVGKSTDLPKSLTSLGSDNHVFKLFIYIIIFIFILISSKYLSYVLCVTQSNSEQYEKYISYVFERHKICFHSEWKQNHKKGN